MSLKPTYRALRVAEVRRETDEAVSILFELPEELAEDYQFAPGQYLTLRTQLGGKEVVRSYSVCTSPLEQQLRVAVKALAGGAFSSFANETLEVGDELDVLPAAGTFTARFTRTQAHHYAAFAAGSGITPVMSLLKTALAVEPDSHFTLFYSSRTAEQTLFLEELAGLKNRYMARLETFYFLTMEENDIALFNGRLDRAKCDEILATLIDPATIERFFICGPEGMMLGVEQALLGRGVTASRIMLERFVSATSSAGLDDQTRARARDAAGRRIGVVLDGCKRTVPFDAEQGNILDSVRAAGVSAPYACKGGVCATCRAKLVTGSVEMRLNYGLTVEEVAQGYVLTCQSIPTSDDVVLSYDL